ncbi:MAG: hypothetical protein ACFCVD_19920 [Nodosilinea sp.]
MASSPSSTYAGLDALKQAFAVYLRDTNLYPGLTAIDCTERSGRLLLLAQHPAPEVNDPNELLRELEAAFRDLMPTVGLPHPAWARAEVMPVRIYLRLVEMQQPYAIHTFTWRLEDAATVVFPPGPVAEGREERRGHVAPPDVENPELEGRINGSGNAILSEINSPWATATHDSSPALEPFNDVTLALPDPAVQNPPPHPWVQQSQYFANHGWRSLRYYWSYGVAGLILLGSLGFAYALSRPCVVGSCERLSKSAEFYDLAQVTLASNPSSDDLETAQSDLQAAIDLLAPVPTWSSHYDAAQAGLGRYKASIASLDQVIQAKAIATRAAALSQDPPHAVDRWVDVHLLWQQAADRLATVPPESPAYDHAQQKLREYRANYSAIGRRIITEEEAEANFSTAIQTGHLARQRMESANSLAGWQLATKEWQAAIKGLSLIPRGTSAYVEAQTELKDYQQQLVVTTNRANLETTAASHYHQAVQAAREAAANEAKSQWTLAATQWGQAVAHAQQIPADTILSSEVAVLLETYQPALANAQARLRTAVALQRLTALVGQLCADSATPCSVQESSGQIQVNLIAPYAEPLRQAITPPAADGTFAFTHTLSPESQQLIEQIIAVSHQVNQQVAIYDVYGGFVARYRPDLGGFMKN